MGVKLYFQSETFLEASDICDYIPNKSAREFYIGFHLKMSKHMCDFLKNVTYVAHLCNIFYVNHQFIHNIILQNV